MQTETTYFVPLNRHFECWLLKVKNIGTRKRRLSLFTFVEYTSHWLVWNEFINLQYCQHIVNMKVEDNIIDHGINVFIPIERENFEKEPQARHTFLTVVGAEVKGFDTDREAFLGTYGSYAKPAVVERGQCTNSLAVGDNGCGTLQVDLDLKPGETKELVVLLGIGEAGVEGKKAKEEFSNLEKVHEEFKKLKDYWHSRLKAMTVETPDPEFNSMMNMWSPFNCLITYAWSRAASLIYSGERDGLGYRDTVQDLLGVLHTIPEEAGERLELMITGQVSTGGAMPVVKPFAHHPGQEQPPDETEYRSDDCLWLFNTIPAYVKETGDLAFYHKVLPYADKGEDTVLGHMKQAILFNLTRTGAHGLPCGLSADWNDCLQLGYQGESVFVAFQLRYALQTYIEVCSMLDKPDEVQWAQQHLQTLDDNLKKHAWDGEWFLRAFRYDGLKYGSKENDEGSIFLNPQSWAVLSGHATKEQAIKVMNVVRERLATDYGLMICDPPFEKTEFGIVKASLFNKGMKENASVFCHTQGWAIIAETMLGNGDRAYQYFRAYMPAAYNTKAEIRQIEPYVYCQFTHSKYSPRYGASRTPWLSGSAAWAYYAATQYILGIQPDYYGLKIDPCIPSSWKEFKVRREFRKKVFDIKVQNDGGVQKGVKKIILNGEELEDNLIPLDKMKKYNTVIVLMG
ncbi:MAG: N,N'-diacetylchitobiose phosphorylase [candidate division KSB1 bacterium]|nr:N,N'-diacetylchitobiose phosphorylase [candidate division KSB1 bacterium]